MNSSLHSYLILAYAGSEKAAEDVGFYYAANAAGRLRGSCCRGALPGGWHYRMSSWLSALGRDCWLIVFLLPTSPEPLPAKERLA